MILNRAQEEHLEALVIHAFESGYIQGHNDQMDGAFDHDTNHVARTRTKSMLVSLREVLKINSTKSQATRAKNPKFQRTSQHIAAKVWTIRDPQGVPHEFKNLANWIRENEHRFSPDDVCWRTVRTGETCPAYNGLASLSPRLRRPQGSWRGWTWVSIPERRFDDGADPLARSEHAKKV